MLSLSYSWRHTERFRVQIQKLVVIMMLALALMFRSNPMSSCSKLQSLRPVAWGLLQLYKRLVLNLFSVDGKIGLTYSDNGPSILRFYNFRIYSIVKCWSFIPYFSGNCWLWAHVEETWQDSLLFNFLWVLLLDSLFESSPNYLCPNNLLFNFRFCFWAVIETQSTWATKNIVRSEKNMQSYMHI